MKSRRERTAGTVAPAFSGQHQSARPAPWRRPTLLFSAFASKSAIANLGGNSHPPIRDLTEERAVICQQWGVRPYE